MKLNKYLFLVLMLIPLLWVQACGEDVQLPNEILGGEIDGNEWQFEIGKANSDQINRTFIVELYNFGGFSINEGCLLFPGNNAYLSLIVPFGAQNGQQLDAISANLIFHQDGINALTADRGFVEISFINGSEIRGFISAGSSTENSVQGFFSVLICS